MRILIVVDKIPSAIWICAKSMNKMKDWFDYDIVAVHPKRPSVEQLETFRRLALKADLIDFQYWKTAEMLLGSFAFLKNKPKILTHHNPYDLDRLNWWEKYNEVVITNSTMEKIIKEAFRKQPVKIPLSVDLGFFKFQREYPEDKPFKVNMIAARIEDKKGILEVAKACRLTKTRFVLVGRISDMDYMRQIMGEAGNLIDFRQDISDEKLLQSYYETSLHINNSADGFESGCYDDKTEILTDKGWKLFRDLDKTEKVATLNPETNYLEYQKPTKYITQDNHKELYCVNNRAISFAVTGNHNMWVAKRRKKYGFVRADKLPSHFRIKRTCKWSGSRYRECDKDWFRFLGIWLAEGSVYRQSKNSCRISIAAVKPDVRRKIKQLLIRMGIRFSTRKDQFIFSERQNRGYKFKWGKYLEQFGKAGDKFVPKEVLTAKRSNINEFLNWYVMGDGAKYNGARKIWTSSRKMADGLQECFIKVGNHANIKVRDNRGRRRWIKNHWAEIKEKEYIIYERVKKAESYVRRGLDVEVIPYGGKVYCVEVPNHILLVRRKGTPYFCGNTLPILESMATGVPVLTRNIGHVPDIANGKNMVVRPGAKDNIKELAEYIEALKKDRNKRLRLREEGFNTVLSMDDEYTARRYYRLYRKVLYKKPLVSVIIPTYNRKEVLGSVLASVAAQTYSNIEIIVVDDGSTDGTEKFIKDIRESLPIKYIKQKKDGYGLARARNQGVVEANGDILVFLDDRFLLDVYAVENFVKSMRSGIWLFGNKGADKKSFVENLSCVYKKDLVRMGMFNERIVYYGGLTKDTINRMNQINLKPVYCPEATAKPLISSKSRYIRKDDIIKAKLLLWKLWGGK